MTYADFMMPPRPDRSLRRMLVAILIAAVTVIAGRAVAEQAAPQQPGAQPPQQTQQTQQTQQYASSEDMKGEGGKKRTVLRFGEDDIHGDITRPDGELVQAPRKPSQPTLLRVRRNFLDRALSGAERGQ